VAIFLIVAGARLWLIGAFGGVVPIHDEWDADGAAILKPWVEGRLGAAELFATHNEHRPVISRLLVVALTALNGQWDPRLAMVFSALLCGGIAAGLGTGLQRLFPEISSFPLLAAVTLWLALPYGHENTLWGFQSAFYFLLLFSLLTIWNLCLQPLFSTRWWVGAAAALLACFSMASGFLCVIAVVPITALRALRSRVTMREAVTLLALGLMAGGFFLSTRVQVPHHAVLQASSLPAFTTALARNLAWPYPQIPVLCLFTWLLTLLLGVAYLRRDRGSNEPLVARRSELLLAISVWVFLQAAAIAYTRGGQPVSVPPSRYMDVLALGTLTNFLALAALIRRNVHAGGWKQPLASVWIVVIVAGAVRLSVVEIGGQRGRDAYLRRAEQNIRRYVATGHRTLFSGNPRAEITYPDAARLMNLLDDPAIRSLLPAGMREPLRVEIRSDGGAAFQLNGYPEEAAGRDPEPAWGSYDVTPRTGSAVTDLIRSRSSYLLLETAGRFGDGISLDVRAEKSGRDVRFIPTRRVNKHWRAGVVRTPGKQVRLVATDLHPEKWFAFRAPREIGRYSLYSERIVEHGPRVFLAGALLWLATIIYGVARRFARKHGPADVAITAS
jgi:hypothetical protein